VPCLVGEEPFHGIEPQEAILIAALVQQLSGKHRHRCAKVYHPQKLLDHGEPRQGDRLMITCEVPLALIKPLNTTPD
jgi:hypothetical protein